MDESWCDSCLICGQRYFSEDEMTKHIELDHATCNKENDIDKSKCPFCTYVVSNEDENKMETHVMDVHKEEMRTPKKDECGASSGSEVNGECSSNVDSSQSKVLSCPVCQLTGFDNVDTLTFHTESHFIDNEQGHMSLKSDYTQDELLAIKLQEQERFELQASRDVAENLYFEELRSKYGMGKEHQRTGFRNQAFKNMDKQVGRASSSCFDYYSDKFNMLEKLEMGIDDGMTIRSDVHGLLKTHLEKTVKPGTRTWLASSTHFIGRGPGDSGWGCGYRNIQMIISNLNENCNYKDLMKKKFDGNIPSIPKLQELIESAWSEGFDARGREQLESKVVGTRKWIGATEAFAFLSSIGLHCRIIDFPRPSGPKQSHPLLLNWIIQYFDCENISDSDRIIVTSKPPLYLQHEGHSRSIIGIQCEDSSNKNSKLIPMKILIFDPGDSKFQLKNKGKKLKKSSQGSINLNRVIKPISCLNKDQYQIVCVEGIATQQRLQQQKNPDSVCEKVQ
uniref:zinc finger-containing ubiquitin peptidase 1-like n=1 Tax=Styela clava TaxID=7725 RepID=UPI00193A9426|nr:zinc finger-containing ubiquitin peptidase 1-like [Styela clava]